MATDQARERLETVVKNISDRMRELEARPTLEEIEKLKAERESDLNEIKELRSQIQELLRGN